MRHRGSDRRRSGFSLLELMFAMSILTVGIMASFSSQVGSMGLMRSSRETQTATADLRAVMEDLLTRTPAFLVTNESSPYLPGQPVDDYSDRHLTDQQMVATYPNFSGGAVPNTLQVVLTCTWNDFEGRERKLALRTVLSQ